MNDEPQASSRFSNVQYLRNFTGIVGVVLVSSSLAAYDWRLGVLTVGVFAVVGAIVGMVLGR